MKALCCCTLLIFALVLSGCAKSTGPNPPSPPTPPQVQIANDVNTLAQSLDTAITGLRAARDQGKISAADVATAEKVARPIAVTVKQINAELRTADDWPTMKAKLLAILKAAAIQNAAANLPESARATLAAVLTVYNAIAFTIGAPTI